MEIKTQIKKVLLICIGTFFMLSGIYVIWLGLMNIPCFIIHIPFIDLNMDIRMMKDIIFYVVGILIGIILTFGINAYIRPILKSIGDDVE